jgi:hypothetical protein
METWQHQAYAGTGQDSHGNMTNAWADPVEVTGCMFDPGGTTEPGYGTRTVSTPTLYAPMRTVVTPQDVFVGRGKTWVVDGEPADWTVGILVIPLRRVEG